MAKGIASYPVEKQNAVINRRLEHNTGGLGYLAALEAQKLVVRNALIAQGKIKPAPENK
jgi:hypothetical protein